MTARYLHPEHLQVPLGAFALTSSRLLRGLLLGSGQLLRLLWARLVLQEPAAGQQRAEHVCHGVTDRLLLGCGSLLCRDGSRDLCLWGGCISRGSSRGIDQVARPPGSCLQQGSWKCHY